MRQAQKIRRVIVAIIIIVGFGVALSAHPDLERSTIQQSQATKVTGVAADALETLVVKGRAPKTDYSRQQFGDGWASEAGCDMRNVILKRDLKNVVVNAKCQVVSGTFDDTYTGATIAFTRGADSSSDVQIDHVVALSDAWQKGAQQLSPTERETFANDPLELLASSGVANQQKSDADAASWLPSNKPFRCQYVARQIAVKKKYNLWVTGAEKEAIRTVLATCPGQILPTS
jgi:hypothetical protein